MEFRRVLFRSPDRISRRRNADGEDWISAGGRAVRLDPLSPLAREEWLAVGEVQGRAAGARILSAAPIDAAAVKALFPDRIKDMRTVRFRPDTGGVETLRERRNGALRLASGPDDSPDPSSAERTVGQERVSTGVSGWTRYQ